MPKYKFQFARDYTVREGFDRIIEAPSLAEAEAAAVNLATEFNNDCPDDCSEYEGGGAGGFDADLIDLGTSHASEEPDYVVLDDGQVVPYET